MNILVIDTGFSDGLVAAQRRDGKRAERMIGPFGTHGEKVLGAIAEVLDELGLKTSELDRVGLGQGPGSFTGLRIALATAQGLAQGLDLQVIAYATFEALPRQRDDDLIYAFDARRGQLFAARLAAGQLSKASCEDPSTVATWVGPDSLVFGDAPGRYPQVLEAGARWLEGPYTIEAQRALELTATAPLATGPVLPTYRRGAEAQVLYGSPKLDRALDGDELQDDQA